jgi:rod shape-determining protein MreD
MNFLITIAGLLLLSACQSRLPTLWWLGGLRIELLPALVAYGALTFRRGPALIFALTTGFTQDALSASPFGLSALAYGIAATILSSLHETFDRDLPWVQMGAGALASMAISFAACCVVGFGIGAVLKALALAAISAVVTPLLFFVLDYARYKTRAQ